MLTPSPSVQKSKLLPFEVNQAVVGLSLEESDETLLAYFRFFAGRTPVEHTTFLHVLPSFDLFNTFLENENAGAISNFEIHQDFADKVEKKVLTQLKGLALRPNVDVEEGDPLEELLFVAADTNADLIMVGRRTDGGRHGILARNLARKVSCPALIIPQGALPQLHRIVVPIDFSKNAAQALRTAVSLAHRFGENVEVVAVNVYELPHVAAYMINKTQEELHAILLKDRQAALVDFMQATLGEEAGMVRTALVEKDWSSVSNHLLEFAKQENADLLVVGAKGHSRVERLLLGSVTESLLANTETLPILVVK